jgi:hypothetical protein
MREDEYDALIDDPTGFLYEVWFPRVCADAAPMGGPSTLRNNLAFVKGGMAMLQYFYAFGPQIQRLRTECGTASAIAGIFKAPFDILADKLRGYVGLTMDMHTQPDKVLKACEALMPHLCHVGLTTADPAKQVPIGFWMHRGCVPFVNPRSSPPITGPRSSRSSRNSGSTGTKPCSMPKANGGITTTPSANCPTAASFTTATAMTSSRRIDGSTTSSP